MQSSHFVYIDNLKVHAYHGVLPQERQVGNDYAVNVIVEYPWSNAIMTDDVADTLNYATLADIITEEMRTASNLLEHVAGRIVEKVKTIFPQTISIELDIKKIAPPIKQDTNGCGVKMKIVY